PWPHDMLVPQLAIAVQLARLCSVAVGKPLRARGGAVPPAHFAGKSDSCSRTACSLHPAELYLHPARHRRRVARREPGSCVISLADAAVQSRAAVDNALLAQ